MESLKNDLKRYTAKGLTLLACLSLITSVLLVWALVVAVSGSHEKLLVCVVLALIVAITSAQHPLKLLGSTSAVSLVT